MHACAVSVYQALSKEPGYEAKLDPVGKIAQQGTRVHIIFGLAWSPLMYIPYLDRVYYRSSAVRGQTSDIT